MNTDFYYELKQDRIDLFQYGYSDFSMDTPLHFHRAIELIYVTGGRAKCQVGNKSFIAEKGDILFANPCDLHACFPHPEHKQLVLIWGNSYTQDFSKFFQSKRLPVHLRDKEFNRNLFEKLKYLFPNTANDFYVRKGITNIILGELINHYPHEPMQPASQMDTIQLVLDYLEQHYAEKITLLSLSMHFGYDKYYFSKLFNRYIGENLNAYLNRIRIRAILSLSKHMPHTPLLQIAFNNGFQSEATFRRALKDCKNFFDEV